MKRAKAEKRAQAQETVASSREQLLDSALRLIRERGYCGTTVDELCAAAGVTKGAFFHHFASKEALAVAAAERFAERAEGMFAQESNRALGDPAARLLAYIEQRRELMRGGLEEGTCLLGTMVQETYETHPAIRDACSQGIFGHAEWLEADIRQAMEEGHLEGDWTAAGLAAHIVGAVQGAFILAKARLDWEPAVASLEHLRRYVEMLLARPGTRRAGAAAGDGGANA